MMITSLLSTFGGALFGGIQNYLEHKQDSKCETEIAKIQADKEIELAKQGIIISQNQLATQQSQTTQEQIKTDASLKQSDTEEYKSFADAVAQTSSLWQNNSILADIANFTVCTTRPFITYILLGFVIFMGNGIMKNNEITANHLIIFDLVLGELSGIMSYWFVRRSFEKRNQSQLQLQKKKLNIEEVEMPQDEKKTTIITKAVDKIKSFATPNSKKIAIKIIKEFEGLKLKAYKCPANVWTIGYGHTKDVTDGMKITQIQAEYFLVSDLTIFYNCVTNEVGDRCNANQIAALTSFAFNVGNGNFLKSTLLKVIKSNPSNFTEIEKQFMCWIYAGSKIPLKGLMNRRKIEANWYEKA